MGISMAKQGDTMVVDVNGQLLAKNRNEVKTLVTDAILNGERKFRIDLRRTGYIDSSGLGVLVSLSKRTREVGGDLCLANLNSDLQHLFSTTRLDTLFRFESTDEGDRSAG